MDLSSLLGRPPALLDYLGQGRSGHFDSVAQGMTEKINRVMALANGNGAAQGDASGIQISLSEEAQALLASSNGAEDGKLSGVQKGAQNFLMSFFDQSDVDFKNLSADALDLIQGLGEVIAGSGGTARDLTTDIAESKYNDGRKVYTLTGNNTRLRVAIDYTADGAPAKLSVTDIAGGKVETAEITLTREDDASLMTIIRTQREYQNGYMVKLSDIDPLAVDLYAKAA